ncbi:MAG: TilS substrate-binding domain-containing protein, partial [Mycolicibacterium aromaticivorans]|nr:TilS substrate-binding domain-containing protein [Mycolicibacterium aromaticivorans]
ARTAAALREDTDALDNWAALALENTAALGDTGDTVAVTALAGLPTAVRRRVIRGWLLGGGATNLTDKQIRAVDALVTAWHGQGGVAVGSELRQQRLFAARRDGRLMMYTQPV